MEKEYGCGQKMLDGGKCTSLGVMPCLCDVCQLKVIRELETFQQSVQWIGGLSADENLLHTCCTSRNPAVSSE